MPDTQPRSPHGLPRLAARLACLLLVGQAALVLGSWLLSVLAPGIGAHSMLDGEGMRWFFSDFARMVGGKGMAWLVLGASALGCMRESGLAGACRRPRGLSLRERSALTVAAFFALLYLAVVAVLTLPRHAVLEGVGGTLWPSPFGEALGPVVAFGLCLVSLVHGWVGGRLDTLSKAFRSLHCGISKAAPLLLLYVLAAQFLRSLLYVACGE